MNRTKLILLVGIPGSGKTTYAQKYIKEHPNTVHFSSDAIRKELYGDERIQGDANQVFHCMGQSALKALNNGQNVVYDSTSMTRKDRASIISACPKFVRIEAHIIWQPIETCIERDATRERSVGKDVIDKMLKRFQAPFYDEGFDEIRIVRPEGFATSDYTWNMLDCMKIPHDNPHHKLNIYDHCVSATEYLKHDNRTKTNIDMQIAALLHDVGKPYTKEFKNTSGEPSETAHFYQHHCVGSYISYGITNVTPYIAWLISTHMDPFMNTKYYRTLPPFLKGKIDILNEADLAAH